MQGLVSIRRSDSSPSFGANQLLQTRCVGHARRPPCDDIDSSSAPGTQVAIAILRDLCWVHAERLVHKLDTFTDQNRAAQATVRAAIWQLYRDLKAYRCAPTVQRKAALVAEFDRIFTSKTGFVTLDRLLARLHANKAELLSQAARGPLGHLVKHVWPGYPGNDRADFNSLPECWGLLTRDRG